MSSQKTRFLCKNCGFESVKWLGKCPSCEEWNTFQEEKAQKKEKPGRDLFLPLRLASRPENILDIPDRPEMRLLTPDQELNRVLGGGIVPGSVILLGGEPGIGKSTLLLQVALRLKGKKVLYVSGEESSQQIRMRAGRIQEKLQTQESCFVLTETSTSRIFELASEMDPDLIIIDSIQTLESPSNEGSPGSVSQLRDSAGEFVRYAKESLIPVFLIGHITKDGAIAGPKILEHMVDVVIQFEGDRHHAYRILRTLKNRFGATSELGIYEMEGAGLKEIPNPSDVFLSNRKDELSGVGISVIMEGARALLIECQALVSNSAYGTPQRSSIGFDTRRMSMLLAVLEKRSGFKLSMKDVFLNITGGMRVEDPSIDLGLLAAIVSSQEDLAIPSSLCFSGEIGLSGEIRAVTRIEQRISEAEKLGFKKIFISDYNKVRETKEKERFIEVVRIANIEQLLSSLFS